MNDGVFFASGGLLSGAGAGECAAGGGAPIGATGGAAAGGGAGVGGGRLLRRLVRVVRRGRGGHRCSGCVKSRTLRLLIAGR